VAFDWAAVLGVPVKVMNDAAMQALGSDEGGRMLFLGLGSGLGTALVDDGAVVALELAHLPFKNQTFEDLLGQRGLASLGAAGWRAAVLEGAALLRAAVAAEYVVLGGGNVRLFAELPPAVAVWAVVGLLTTSAAAMASTAAGRDSRIPARAITWATGLTLLGRGAIGLPVSLTRGRDTRFGRLDATLYSPLCLALGAASVQVARDA